METKKRDIAYYNDTIGYLLNQCIIVRHFNLEIILHVHTAEVSSVLGRGRNEATDVYDLQALSSLNRFISAQGNPFPSSPFVRIHVLFRGWI